MEFADDPGHSIVHDMERVKHDLATMFQSALESGRFMPPGSIADRIMPAIRGEFPVDIRVQDDEMIVSADLPGVEKEDISIKLAGPKALEIDCERKGDDALDQKGFFVRERIAGPVRRLVHLPAEVTEDGATAAFTNGVLEIRLKIVGGCRRTAIGIE